MQVDSSSTKKSTQLTLIDKLSRLSYQQTLKPLGSDAPRLLRAGGKWNFRIEEDVYLGPDLFRLKFPLAAGESESERAILMISLVETSYDRLQWHCTACESLCEHVGAGFAFILDEKMALGLAAPPAERVPAKSLSEKDLIRQAIDERRERARAERMTTALQVEFAGVIKKILIECRLFRAAFDCDAIRELDPVLYEFAAFARVIDFHPLVRQLSHKTLTPVFGQERFGQEVSLARLLFQEANSPSRSTAMRSLSAISSGVNARQKRRTDGRSRR